MSMWCKDIFLSSLIQKKISEDGKNKFLAGMLRYSERKRKERIERRESFKISGADLVGKVTERDMLVMGLGMYWGEGYKYENSELGFTNSNPKIIIFYIRWLNLFGVSINDLIFRLTINSFFKEYESEIKSFWINLLGVKEIQFSKTTIIKTLLLKASLEERQRYKGILRVKARRGLDLKNKILGAIEHISKHA